MTIGDRIREYREMRHLTQQQLAERIGESRGTLISNYENYAVP